MDAYQYVAFKEALLGSSPEENSLARSGLAEAKASNSTTPDQPPALSL
jgi:hypothetical protein